LNIQLIQPGTDSYAQTSAFSCRGLAFYHKSDCDRVIADYSKAAEMIPHSTVPLNNRGNAYCNKGK